MSELTIQLDEHWRIRRYDDLNFVLEYFQAGGINRRTKELGPDKWVIKGFYSGLADAIRALPIKVPLDPRIRDFDTLRRRLSAIAASLEECAGELVGEMESSVRSLAQQLAGRLK